MPIKSGCNIVKYIITMKNISPMVVGNDEGEPIITDDNKVYIPATTMAGALKDYISSNFTNVDVNDMFGNDKKSKIYVYDMYGDFKGFEERPSIKIDSFSGTTSKGHKFDRKMICKNHIFTLKVEIYHDNKDKLSIYEAAFESSIHALNNGDITIGSYKSIGAGLFEIENMKKCTYNLNDKKDLFAYLKDEKKLEEVKINNDKYIEDNIVTFELLGELKTPILIGGYESLDSDDVDKSQMKDKEGNYLIPGSSIKGVIKNEVKKIFDYFGKEDYLEYVFGTSNLDQDNKQSRFISFESTIINNNYDKLLYNKIKIDKFTGGTVKSALVQEEPVLGDINIKCKYRMIGGSENLEEINNSTIGAIALVLRDMAIGNVSLGGGYAVGRGKIQGKMMIISKGNEILFKGDILNNNIIENNLDKYIADLNSRKDR